MLVSMFKVYWTFSTSDAFTNRLEI